LEILDNATDKPEKFFAGNATLFWDKGIDVDYYSIKELVDALYVERARVADRGERCFTWTSRWLEDAATHRFQIIPVGINGNAGDPLPLMAIIARKPDRPDFTIVYSKEDHKITVTIV
jgi:hypothetical protein